MAMNIHELVALLPLDENIPVTLAAQILHPYEVENAILDLIRNINEGHYLCKSHSGKYIFNDFSPESGRIKLDGLPELTQETDPSTVLMESKEAVWLWCVGLEQLRLDVKDFLSHTLPPREKVQALYDELHSMAGIPKSRHTAP